MILRPVSPQSPCGPPITNRPVGLTWIFVSLSMSSLGMIGLMISSRTPSAMRACDTSGVCCVLTTIASQRATLSPSYSSVTCVLPSGRRKSSRFCLRTSDIRRASLCAYMIGAGISSAVSSHANPNIIP